MARIAGVDIPNQKRVEIALTYIYGIGRKSSNDILARTGIDPDKRAKDLTEEEIAKIRDEIEALKKQRQEEEESYTQAYPPAETRLQEAKEKVEKKEAEWRASEERRIAIDQRVAELKKQLNDIQVDINEYY